jgi:hypothetical protein
VFHQIWHLILFFCFIQARVLTDGGGARLQFTIAHTLEIGCRTNLAPSFDPIGSFFSYKGLVVCSRVFQQKLQKQGASSSRYIRQRQAFPKMYLGCRPTGDGWSTEGT